MKVVSYCRYSSDNQREESIEAQQRAIAKYCEDKGYDLVDQYIDMALSATNDNRPEFQRMIHDSKKKRFQGVVVHKLDRFARNRYDSAIYGHKLQENNVKVISVLENLDDSPESIILRSVIEGYNEYYSINLARETMKGLKENAYTARHNGGIPPYGYDVGPDKKYIINEKEAEAVRLMFKLYLEGHGYGEIGSILTKLGYRTKTGKDFGKNSCYDILGNEKYTGVYVYNKRASTKKGVKQNRKHKSEDEIIRIQGGMPAIISKSDFEKIRVKRNQNKRASGRFSAKEDYMLSGLVTCGKCGGAMTGARSYSGRSKTLRVVYECSRRKRDKSCDAKSVRKEELELRVYESIKEDLYNKRGDRDFLSTVQSKIDSTHSENLARFKSLEKNLRDIDLQLEKIIDAITSGMDPTLFVDRSRKLQKEKESIVVDKDLVEFTILENKIKIEDIKKKLSSMDIDGDKRELFSTWIKSVTVYDDYTDIVYSYEKA